VVKDDLQERIDRHFKGRADIETQELEWHREFGCLMRAQRVASGLSIRSMAILLDLAPSGLCDYENGKRRWTPQLAKVYLEIVDHKTRLLNGVS